jgi:8-oxo-dGTP pyrophosphatase MutT (NUDIX family)
MTMVACTTLNGSTRLFHEKELVLRPAAYAIIIQHEKLLVLRLRHSGRLHLPGGGIHTGERIVDTLKREVKEETGLEIEVGAFVHFEELFFYFDPTGKAYHGLHFYYLCSSSSLHLIDDDQVDDFAAERPRLVDITSLQPEDFQMHGDAILAICRGIIDV